MSVASEINRIKTNIAAAYDEAEAKGATMPSTKNSANLADTVASIQCEKEIPVDPNSLKPLEFGIDADGFFFSDTAGTGNSFGFGRDSTGIYAEATT